MTKSYEEAVRRFRAAKQHKQAVAEEMLDYLKKKYEQETGLKANYAEIL